MRKFSFCKSAKQPAGLGPGKRESLQQQQKPQNQKMEAAARLPSAVLGSGSLCAVSCPEEALGDSMGNTEVHAEMWVTGSPVEAPQSVTACVPAPESQAVGFTFPTDSTQWGADAANLCL